MQVFITKAFLFSTFLIVLFFDANFAGLFYLCWLGGIGVCLASTHLLLRDHEILNRKFWVLIGLKSFWLLTAFACVWFLPEPNYHDANFGTFWGRQLDVTTTHLKYWTVAAFYSGSSIVAAYFLIKLPIEKLYRTSVLFVGIWSFFSGLFLLLYYFGLHFNPNGNFSGFFKDRNLFAINCVFIIIFYSYMRNSASGRSIFLDFLAFCFLPALVSISNSVTGSILVLGFCIGFILLNLNDKQPKKFVFIILVSLLVFSSNTWERAHKFADYFSLLEGIPGLLSIPMFESQSFLHYYNSSPAVRMALLELAVETVAQHPFTGVGFENFRNHARPPGFDAGTHAHNNYFEIWLGGGVFSLLAYYLPAGLAFFRASFLLSRKDQNSLGKKDRALMDFGRMILAVSLVLDLTVTSYAEFGLVFFASLGFVGCLSHDLCHPRNRYSLSRKSIS